MAAVTGEGHEVPHESSAAEAHTISAGRFVYPDGAVYEGGYIAADNGAKLKHGKGKYADGHASYEGEFSHDAYHGHGLYVGASGATYEGSFVNNRFEGQGTYKWADGAVYVGHWVNGVMHGEGSYTSADGVQHVGQFWNGMYVDGKTHIAVR